MNRRAKEDISVNKENEGEKLKGKIISLVDRYVKVDFSFTKVSDLIFKYGGKISISNKHKYDRYKVEQFLVIYKIAKLAERGVINERTKDVLEDLYKLKIATEHKIGEQMLANSSKRKSDDFLLEGLKKRLELINEELEKYNLNIQNFDFDKLFDAIIETESYENANEEELNDFVRKLK